MRLHVEGAPDVKTLLYTGEEGMTLAPGDRVSGIARYDLADVVRGETVTYYEAKGVFLRAFASGTMEREPTGSPPAVELAGLCGAGAEAERPSCFPADMAGFFNALVTGDRSDMDDGEYMALQRAGLSPHRGGVRDAPDLLRRHAHHAAVQAPSPGAGVRRDRGDLFLCGRHGQHPLRPAGAMMQSITLLVPLLGREEDKPTTLAFILTLLLAVNPTPPPA